jgi:hypothetical protein
MGVGVDWRQMRRDVIEPVVHTSCCTVRYHGQLTQSFGARPPFDVGCDGTAFDLQDEACCGDRKYMSASRSLAETAFEHGIEKKLPATRDSSA